MDAERNRLMEELEKAGWAEQVRWVDGFHHHLEGRNGGGDLWRTDGRLGVVVLRGRQTDASKSPKHAGSGEAR